MQRPEISIRALLLRQHAHWFLGFGLVFTLGFGAAFVSTSGEARDFARHGVETEATVERTYTTTRRDSEGRRQTVYRVAYDFELPDGATQSNSETVSRGYYRSVSAGDRVDVRYLPDDPGTAELEEGRTARESVIFGLIALGAAGGTAGYGWWLWQRLAAMIRAARRGERRSAKVLAHVASKARQNDTPLYQLHWIDSAYREGHSLKHKAEELLDWPEGSEITVYVDPRTDKTFWEGDLAAP